MGLVRSTLMCVLWGCLALFDFSIQCNYETEVGAGETPQDGAVEARARHRLQLLFPLLLRISTRLATLVPTALMALLGIIVFVVFSKKAFIISLFALFLSLSGKYKNKGDDIYIHKVNSYPDYNGEEHIHYHHPLKYKKQYYEGNRPYNNWKHVKRNLLSPSWEPGVWPARRKIQPFKPLPNYFAGRTYPEDVEDSSQDRLRKDITEDILSEDISGSGEIKIGNSLVGFE